MKKNTKNPQQPVCFQERTLVVAVRHALPYLMGLSVALSAIHTAYSRSSDSAAAFTATQLVRQFTLKNTVSQVSMGMQGYVSEVNGEQRAPAMGARPTGFPTDMGSVPDSVNLPQRDGAGRPLGYCAWDNTTTNITPGHNAGQGVSSPLVYAVVSPGLNGNMQTSCAHVLANRVGVGDDHVQFVAPMQVSSAQYKSSVATFADLLAGDEGDVRLVRDTNKLYSYVGGTWQAVQAGPFEPDAAGGAGAIAYTTGKVTVADFQAATATITGAVSADNATFTNGVVASTFTGNGAGLSDLNAANFSSGIVSPEFGGTGVNGSAAGNGTLLIGNGSGFTLGTLTAGAGISVLNDVGAITISNSGVISITGTADQIITSASNGDIVLSLPQAIATTSIPTFAGMMLNGGLTGTNATFSGLVTVDSLSALRLNVGTSAGPVSNPNLIIGNSAMPGAQSGDGNNAAIGIGALNQNTSGQRNTAVGNLALYANTTGSSNTANGFAALFSNTTGNTNVAIGNVALYGNTTGNNNVAIGSGAGYSSLSGVTTNANTTGGANTFLGSNAMPGTTTPLFNATALGAEATVSTTNTLALGRNSALDQIVMGTDTRNDTFANTKLYVNGVTNLNGDLRGTTATFTGAVTANSFAGDGSGLTNLNASNFNSGILPVEQGGTGLDGSAAANGSLLIGNGTGYTLGTLTGTADQVNVTNGAGTITLSLPQSIATTSTPTFGGLTLNGALTGTTGTFTGAVTVDSLAAQRLNVGTSAGPVSNPNLIIGNNAITGAQTGGGANTAVGVSALNLNTSGERNTAVGYIALFANTTGSSNTATGIGALFSNTTGNTNVAIGNVALYGNTTGNNNVAIGSGAGYSSLSGVTTNANTTGGANTFLGSNAMPGTTTPLFNATALGAEATVSTSNTLALGRNGALDQIVMGTDTRNDTFANTKLYVNGVTNLNGDLRGTTATFTGAVSANSFAGDGSGLTNLNASNFNSGILPVEQGGTGLDGSAAANGSLLIGNGTGYTLGTLTGTADQVNVTNGAGTITLSLPQSIATTSTPTFGGLTLNGALTGTTGTFTGAVSVDSLAALRLNVGTSAGGLAANNLIIGNNAMVGAQTGQGGNVAVGQNALRLNTSGGNNTATGVNALAFNTTGSSNIASGRESLYENTTGSRNVAIGASAGRTNTTGNDNTFLGFDADATSGALTFATAIGSGSRVATSATMALGRNSALDQIVIGTDTRNDTFAGTKLYVNGVTNLNGDLRGTTANFSGRVDAASLFVNGTQVTGGGSVTRTAIQTALEGNFNLALGTGSLQNGSFTGANNAVFGVGAAELTTGASEQNVVIGRLAGRFLGRFTAADGNTLVGYQAGQSIQAASGGDYNTLIGHNSDGGSDITYGTALGTSATVTGASYSTAIGAGSTVATSDTIALGRNSTSDQVVIGTASRVASHKLYVVGTAHVTAGVTTDSDRRLKTNINQLDTDTMLEKLGQIGAYSYSYTAMPSAGKKIGIIAQEIESLFPEVANYGNGSNFLSVDYGALGAMAAVGVGQLNTKVKALDKKVDEQGTKLLALEQLTGKHDTRIGALESWKTEAVGRMDTMQTAIDLNIQKIADNAVAIQTNAKAIERLDDALLTLDGTVKGNTDAIAAINARWARNFTAADDGSSITVNAVELKVSNFTAQQMRANSVYSQRLEAEIARIAELEVNNLRANTAVANTVQAEQLNTGSVQVYAGVGLPAVLFAAKADGHYTVSTSSLDGSYATATVIVNAGQAKVVSVSSEGIELVAEGNMVKAIAAGKSIKASWIKMG